jgi:hypothetical protein
MRSNQLLDQDFQVGYYEKTFELGGKQYTAALHYRPQYSNDASLTIRMGTGDFITLPFAFSIKIKVQKTGATSWVVESTKGTDKKLRDLVRDSLLRAYMVTPVNSSIQQLLFVGEGKILATNHWLKRNKAILANGELIPKATAVPPKETPISSLIEPVTN